MAVLLGAGVIIVMPEIRAAHSLVSGCRTNQEVVHSQSYELYSEVYHDTPQVNCHLFDSEISCGDFQDCTINELYLQYLVCSAISTRITAIWEAIPIALS